MQRSRLFPSLLLATTLAIGFLIVWAFVGSYLRHLLFPLDRVYANLVILPDGAPLLSFHTHGVFHYDDLRGHRVQHVKERWLSACRLSASPAVPRHGLWILNEAETWWLRVKGYNDASYSPTFWYLIQDGGPAGSGYFTGFDVNSRRQVGFLGKTGFTLTLPPKQDCFPLTSIDQQTHGAGSSGLASIPRTSWGVNLQGFDSATVFLLTDDRQLYEIGLKDRSVHRLLDDSTVLSAGILPPAESDTINKLVVRTDREVLLLNGRDQIERRYALPTELTDRTFEWGEISPGLALATAYVPSEPADESRKADLLWFDAAGVVSKRETAVLPGNRSTDPLLGLAAPMPLANALLFGLLHPIQFLESNSHSWPEAIAISLREFWPSLLSTATLSVLALFACYRRQRRYAASRRDLIVWTAFVAALGLPGWIGYRFGRRWPALEECSTCRRATPRTSTRCELCHKEIPRPRPLGIELVMA